MSVRAVRAAFALLVLSTISHGLLDDAIDVLKLGIDITEQVVGSWELIGKHISDGKGVELPIVHRMEQKILTKVAMVSLDINRLSRKLDTSTHALTAQLTQLPKLGQLNTRIDELADLVGRIDTAERHMREYVDNQQAIERSTLEDFATWAVSHDPGAVAGLIERIAQLTTSSDDKRSILDRNVLRGLSAMLKDGTAELCLLHQSPQQLLYNIYNTIALTEIKAYAMMQFSWMLLRIYGKGNFTEEASLMRNRYEERSSRMSASIRNAMSQAKRDMYRCDPVVHEEGETFLQITRFLQGYIDNEVNLNSEKSCSENCGFYALAESHGCYNDQMLCARQASCSGRIINCQYIDSDMWICPATSRSNRRYEWIEYENGRTLGKPGSCMRATSKVDSWWRWLFWHCSYCMCFCDEPGPASDRYFSLLEAVSNITDNKVVTGLRFTKKGRVIHLQISEGRLGARATVDQDSVRWQPVPLVEVTRQSDQPEFHTLSYEERAIDLDELDSPKGHLLTGVRFRMIGAHLHFEIRATPFNYTSGVLDPERSQWISNDNTDGTDKPRKKLVLQQPDIPTRHGTQSLLDSNHDQYLEFTHTDLDADAAQSTVPFIDAQPVQPSTIVPLSGAGIAHKGLSGSGGFITPKVFTYDYTPHMTVKSPDDVEYRIEKTVDFVPKQF